MISFEKFSQHSFQGSVFCSGTISLFECEDEDEDDEDERVEKDPKEDVDEPAEASFTLLLEKQAKIHTRNWVDLLKENMEIIL